MLYILYIIYIKLGTMILSFFLAAFLFRCCLQQFSSLSPTLTKLVLFYKLVLPYLCILVLTEKFCCWRFYISRHVKSYLHFLQKPFKQSKLKIPVAKLGLKYNPNYNIMLLFPRSFGINLPSTA